MLTLLTWRATPSHNWVIGMKTVYGSEFATSFSRRSAENHSPRRHADHGEDSVETKPPWPPCLRGELSSLWVVGRRPLGAHGTTTTLPNCSLLARYSCAARVSLKRKVRSTTGFNFPAKTCFSTSSNSPIAPMYEPSTESWRENRKRRSRLPS